MSLLTVYIATIVIPIPVISHSQAPHGLISPVLPYRSYNDFT